MDKKHDAWIKVETVLIAKPQPHHTASPQTGNLRRIWKLPVSCMNVIFTVMVLMITLIIR